MLHQTILQKVCYAYTSTTSSAHFLSESFVVTAVCIVEMILATVICAGRCSPFRRQATNIMSAHNTWPAQTDVNTSTVRADTARIEVTHTQRHLHQ
jgi:hypothetical protein